LIPLSLCAPLGVAGADETTARIHVEQHDGGPRGLAHGHEQVAQLKVGVDVPGVVQPAHQAADRGEERSAARARGRRVAAPARLPGSHGAWEPIAVAESWDGGVGACNSYAYSFEGIALATAPGDWHPIAESYVLQDPGYRIVRRGGMSFLATSRS